MLSFGRQHPLLKLPLLARDPSEHFARASVGAVAPTLLRLSVPRKEAIQKGLLLCCTHQSLEC
jgi:hypothetical protein